MSFTLKVRCRDAAVFFGEAYYVGDSIKQLNIQETASDAAARKPTLQAYLRFMPENQAVLFWGLILGVLRILLFQGRAESPMERVALSLQMKAAKRS